MSLEHIGKGDDHMQRGLTPSLSPQLLVDTRLINPEDPRAKEVEKWIQEMPKMLGQKAPLEDKYICLCRWYEESCLRDPIQRLSILHILLAENGVCFADERVRFLKKRNEEPARHRMDCYINTLLKKRRHKNRTYCEEVKEIFSPMKISVEEDLLYPFGEVAKQWHDVFENAYPKATITWGIQVLEKLVRHCKTQKVKLEDKFYQENGVCRLFDIDARIALEKMTGESLSDDQYEAMVECFIPQYNKAQREERGVTARAPRFVPTLNEAIWKQYEQAKKNVDQLDSCIPEIKHLHEFALQVIAQIGEPYELDLDVDSNPVPRILQNELRYLFPEPKDTTSKKRGQYIDAVDTAGLIHKKLTEADPGYKTMALVWFFYLTKGQSRIVNRKMVSVIKEMSWKEYRYRIRDYEQHKDLFMALLKEFPTEQEYAELQMQIFLLVTGFLPKGAQDPEFSQLFLVHAYQNMCYCAERQAEVDPAILWNYPWFATQREEYIKTGGVAEYSSICHLFEENKQWLERQKNRLRHSYAMQPDATLDEWKAYMASLRNMYMPDHSRDGKCMGKDGLIRYLYSEHNSVAYRVPDKLPGIVDKETRDNMRQCIMEYLGLSLWREHLADTLKEYWLQTIKQAVWYK